MSLKYGTKLLYISLHFLIINFNIMAGGAPISSNTTTNYDPSKNYSLPMAIMTALFFMIGFITVLNDVLIPSLKGLFELQGWQAMLIQFCFYSYNIEHTKLLIQPL